MHKHTHSHALGARRCITLCQYLQRPQETASLINQLDKYKYNNDNNNRRVLKLNNLRINTSRSRSASSLPSFHCSFFTFLLLLMPFALFVCLPRIGFLVHCRMAINLRLGWFPQFRRESSAGRQPVTLSCHLSLPHRLQTWPITRQVNTLNCSLHTNRINCGAKK